MKRFITAALSLMIFVFFSSQAFAVAPSAPVAGAVTAVTAAGFTANWAASATATGYYLDVSTDPAFGTYVVGNGSNTLSVGNVLFKAVAGLTAGTTYYYRVRATNGTISLNSNVITVYTIPPTPTTTAAAGITTSSFNATWPAVAGASTPGGGYKLTVGTSSGGSQTINALREGNTLSVPVLGAAGTTYYYFIDAYVSNNAVYGDSSNSNITTVVTVPTAPVIGTPVVVSDTQFTAVWSAGAGNGNGVAGYYLYVATDSGFLNPVAGYNPKTVAGAATVTSTVTGLGGTQYFYQVQTYTNAPLVTSAMSAAYGSIYTYATAPVATQPVVNSTDITSSGFTARWNASSGATGYSLDVSTSNSFASYVTGYPSTLGAVTSASVTGLSGGTTYYYRLRASDSSGTNPTNSNTITVQTVPATPALTGRTTATAASVTVTWTAATGATGYYLDVSTDPAFGSYFVGNGSNALSVGNVTTYTVNGVTPGTDYYYRVRASNASGTSASSAGVYVDFTSPTLISVTVGTSSSDPSPITIGTGAGASASFNGGPYIRTLTPYFTATFSEPVLGIQYTATASIALKNSAGTLQVLATPYSPVNNTTATPGTPSVVAPSAATFQPSAALAHAACATSKYNVTLTGGITATTIHDAGSATPANDNAMTSAVPFYVTVDTQNPVVGSVTPANSANSQSVSTAITVIFTENCNMDYTLYNSANVVLTNSDGTVIPTNISWSGASSTTLTITPVGNLDFNTTYTLTLYNIADAAGNLLTTNNGTAGSYTSTFTTSADSPTNFTIIPSYLSSPVTPNVLIILDNSNSMDETLTTGDAIGSFNCTDPNNSNTCSRSVLARQALFDLIKTYASKINIGLMSYAVPSNTGKEYVYNNYYFVSYDPRTYCPIIPPPAACYNYCTGENPASYAATDYGVGVDNITAAQNGLTSNYTASTNEADCNSACQTGYTISTPVKSYIDPIYNGVVNPNFNSSNGINPSFQANIREPIINGTVDGAAGSALNGAKRQTYCTNIYPKTFAYHYNDGVNSGTLYHSIVGTFYSGSTTAGTGFLDAENNAGSASSYNTNESNSSSVGYWLYRNKATPVNFTHNAGWNTTNTFNTGYNIGYSNGSDAYGSGFGGTDDDLAQGFLNYGQSNMWYPPYNGAAAPTWSSYPYTYATQLGGFLHVPMALNDPNKTGDNTQLYALLKKLGANSAAVGGGAGTAVNNAFKNDATSYMACGSTGDAANRCSYIVNAGATPTASALGDAISYLNGSLAAVKTQANSGSPSTPIQYSCQKTFVIYVTDGLPSVDGNGAAQDATVLVTGKNAAGTTVTVAGGTVLDKLNTLRCPANPTGLNCGVSNTLASSTTNPVKSDVMTYILGLSMTPKAQTLLDKMAVAGGTADANGHAYYANNPTALNNALVTIFQNILAQLSAGTAASILNNSQGSGANMLQAVFYPNKVFDANSQCGWIGELQNMWYYVDPALKNSSVREDTNKDNELNLKSDKLAVFYFDNAKNQTLVQLFTDATGSGVPSSTTPDATIEPDYVKSLWKAGVLLWSRNLSSDSRTIYTGYKSSTGNTPSLLVTTLFSTDPDLDMLQIPAALTLTQRQTKAATLLNWVNGSDQPNDSDGTAYRARKVTMGTCSNDSSLRCSLNSDCIINGSTGTCTSMNQEWKLGDIISSTPKLVSTVKLNNYDLAAPSGYSDTTYAAFTNTSTYQGRGMAFVGGNDGMLHAFKLGILQELNGKYDKAQINGTNLGHEEWAFVPTSVLPYLTYLSSPSYKHLYLVDKTPAIADVSIGTPSGCIGDYSTCTKDATTWRTVLIGGMGIGGAAKSSTDSCVAPANCVKPPIPDTGLSSYFALDVTNPETPKHLWEFNGDPAHSNYLGYTTTGPAFIRIAYMDGNGVKDNTKNGKWFAVFASGPTGPIDTTLNKFNGQSDQNLKLFIVDLATGTLIKTIDTGIQNAFGGSISTSWIDVDRGNSSANGFYSDDAIYIGYTQLDTTAGTWTKGGVVRLLTQESSDPGSSDPTKQWLLSTLISGTGPITTSITKLQDPAKGKLWIYFGTGRYFYKGDDPSATSTQQLYGVKDPCYSSLTNKFNLTCTSQVATTTTTNCSTILGTATGLCNQTGSASTGPSLTLDNTMSGWFITLAPASGTSYSERVITDPVAITNGNVFFTTFAPNSNVCAFGGNTNIWALNYSTGGIPAAATMQGTALIQSSTGAFAEITLNSAFSNPSNLGLSGRRTVNPIQGVPPTSQGLTIVTSPKPVKKFIHVREK